MTATRVLTPYERTQLVRHLGTSAPDKVPDDIPIEYVTGKVEFCNLVFSITPDALIPRIETEELVHRAEKELRILLAESEETRTLAVADVGTGSGAVIVTLAKLFQTSAPRVHWFGSDISAAAIALATHNALDILGDTQKVSLFVSDLMDEYPEHMSFDLLVANLPYIPHDRIAFLDRSVHAYEPHLALDGGSNGLTLIHAFLRQVTARVRTRGVVLLEIDYTHTVQDFNDFRNDWLIQIDTDSFTRNRFARLERK